MGRERASVRGWKVWVVAALAISAGGFLLPGGEEAVDHTTSIDSLPEPEVAITTTTLAPSSVAVIGQDTFSLIPVGGLDGYARITGPVAFNHSYWVAATAPFGAERVVILSSDDGADWSPQAELPYTEGTIRVDDLGVYGNVLMALGVGSAGSPLLEPLGGNPEEVLLWKSTNGVDWRPELVEAADGLHRYSGLDLVTGDNAVLIGGYIDLALAPFLEEALPPEILSELGQGTLSYWATAATSTTTAVVVVAPPGIEVFSAEIPAPYPGFLPGWLYRSETLAAWQRIETDFPTGDGLVAWPGHGFVAGGYDRPLLSEDGRDWVLSPDLPPAQYQIWNGALLGTHGPFDHLIIETSNGLATVELPPEINMIDQLREGWVDFLAGPGGLAAVRSTFGQSRSGPMSIVSGEITLSVDDGILRAGRGNDPRWAIALGPESVPGIFDLHTRQVTVKPLGTNEAFTLNLDDLQAFWNPVAEPARHEIYVSADGLVWSQGQAALLSERVSLIGGAADTFLLGISRESQPGQFSPAMTVYRTGPVG
jgi:hypothetical protein